MNSKHCPYCHCNTDVIKAGITSSGRQRYRCKKCNKTWTNKPRVSRLEDKIWHDYVWRNLTSESLAEKYGICKRKINTILENHEILNIAPPDNFVSNMIGVDVTYVGRKYGFLSVIDITTGICLYCEVTRGYETVWDYEKALLCLHSHNIYPKVAIVDGKISVIRMFERYGLKVQMCQFHMLRIATCYLTRKPVLEPNIELRNIVLSLPHTNHEMFEQVFYHWKIRNNVWLMEKVKDKSGKWEYSHRKTRTLSRGIEVFLPYLFTYEQLPELNIPKTNNLIEGIHSALKSKLNTHRGAKKSLKTKIVFSFFSGRTGV